jgi:hypothetical protein
MTSTNMQPATFRKKPVVIEAMQFDGTPECAEVICAWANRHGATVWIAEREPKLTVQTLEGNMTASLGDWIICGVKGEFYPCKPEIFEATYEDTEGEE